MASLREGSEALLSNSCATTDTMLISGGSAYPIILLSRAPRRNFIRECGFDADSIEIAIREISENGVGKGEAKAQMAQRSYSVNI